ncbi:hypothetical protein NQ314_005032 [Rhamnusium bicolor]|uniref:Uncharacterized protein n=1 Tax=Rhamnusium bicolor TaxID=1586634 RepID=A0AAV8ZI15_9CUCU|nr:hypothetical protein NQ314_005032 [Rhamnusium bicolor]
MANIPEHWCKVTELSNFTQEEQRNVSIPYENYTFAKCYRYALNWTALLNSSGGSLQNIIINKSWPTEYCVEGWEYDKSITFSSIVIDVSLLSFVYIDKNLHCVLCVEN